MSAIRLIAAPDSNTPPVMDDPELDVSDGPDSPDSPDIVSDSPIGPNTPRVSNNLHSPN